MAWHADKLIATSGGDYTTLQAFESAYDGVDISATDGVRARIKGAPTGSITYWTGWASGQDVDCKIVVEAESGCECDGTDGSGDDAVIGSNQYIYEGTNDLYMDFKNIDFDCPSSYNGITWKTGGTLRVSKCLFRDGGKDGVSAESCRTSNIYVGGCLSKGLSGAYSSLAKTTDADATIVVINSTAASCRYGFFRSFGSLTCKNCAAVNSTTADFYGTISETTCLSDDDGDITNNDSDDFTEPSSDDYTVYNTDSALYEAGTSISDSWFTSLCSTDFAGNSWNDTPAVGCFEYVSAGGTSPVPNIMQQLNQFNGGVNYATN